MVEAGTGSGETVSTLRDAMVRADVRRRCTRALAEGRVDRLVATGLSREQAGSYLLGLYVAIERFRAYRHCDERAFQAVMERAGCTPPAGGRARPRGRLRHYVGRTRGAASALCASPSMAARLMHSPFKSRPG